MKTNPDDIKKQLMNVAALQAKTSKADQSIHDSAVSRLSVVNSRIDAIRPKVMTDKDLADEYIDLIDERGQLTRVIASSRDSNLTTSN